MSLTTSQDAGPAPAAALGMAKGLRVTPWLAAALYLAACASPPKPAGAPLHLEASPTGADTQLTLLSAPGLKINARLKPALELPDGRVLRFDSPRLTPDSAYFAEPPSALASGHHTRMHGTLRASVCDENATVCRTVVLDL